MVKMQKLLIISQVLPEPNSSAAGIRMMQLIEIFLETGFKISFASTGKESEYAQNLENMGIKCSQVQPNDIGFDYFLQTENPQIILFDRFMIEEQFGWRVAEICPNALRILDTEDLHFLRKARQAALKENSNFTKSDLFSETAKREVASIFRCDLSLIISEAERNILTNQFKIPNNLLFYFPFIFEKLPTSLLKAFPSFENRKHFMSIGNFLHPPNLDQTLFLKEKIWPLIAKKLPNADLLIFGAYATKKVQGLHAPEARFFIKGRAEKVCEPMKNARVLIAPLRFGAGLKGKLFDAMQYGTPSITTPCGAEGIQGEMLWGGKIADTPEKLAEEAVFLYQNKQEWEKAQQNGLKIINRRFQKTDFSTRFFDQLVQLQKELKTHRQHNFIGSMLLHHFLKSTKYMSKWIEEKNKNAE